MMNSTLFSVRASTPVAIGIRSAATKTWMPLDGTMRREEMPPASSRTRSVHAPAAHATWRARRTSASPVSSSTASTSPGRRKPVTRTRVAMWAPWAAAVRATAATMRASSSAASWNWTAPTSASARSAGAAASAPSSGEMAVAGDRARAADGVVERQPGAEVRALPAAAAQRPQERDGRDEVGSDPREQQLALAQRLADEPDVAHLEIAQASVDELARGARGPGREVARLDEGHPQSARDRVERRADAGDPTADDEQVELPCACGLERPPPRGAVEPAVGH